MKSIVSKEKKESLLLLKIKITKTKQALGGESN